MQTISISSKQLSVSLIPLGARIQGIQFLNQPMALHYPCLNDYHQDPYYLGASVGPIANRISNAQITIGQHTFSLPNNEGDNCLHSGGLGFDRHLWQLIEHTDNKATFELIYNLADIGMLGTLTVHAIYRIDGKQLHIEYHSQCTHTTYINTTNHVYLNLSGHSRSKNSSSENSGKSSSKNSTAIGDHDFECFGQNFVDVNEHSIPTGTTTPFTQPLRYTANQASEIKEFKDGVDHHFNAMPADWFTKHNQLMARVRSRSSNVSLEVFSNAPGYQLYTGRFLDKPFNSYGGFCIETQCAPDAINHNHLASPLLHAGELRTHSTVLAFDNAH